MKAYGAAFRTGLINGGPGCIVRCLRYGIQDYEAVGDASPLETEIGKSEKFVCVRAGHWLNINLALV